MGSYCEAAGRDCLYKEGISGLQANAITARATGDVAVTRGQRKILARIEELAGEWQVGDCTPNDCVIVLHAIESALATQAHTETQQAR